MDTSLILLLVKDHLGISSSKKDSYITSRIQSSLSDLQDDYGLELDLGKMNQQMFVVDYVAWQIENSPSQEKMPMFLIVRLKNLIIKKAGSYNV